MAVDEGWSQSAEVEHMLPGAIALMLRQSIAGINLVKLYHQAVSSHFSYDGGTGN